MDSRRRSFVGRPVDRPAWNLRRAECLLLAAAFALVGGVGSAFAQETKAAAHAPAGGGRTIVLTSLSAPADDAIAAKLASTITSSVALMMRLTGSITVKRADFLTPTFSFSRARRYYRLTKADGAVFGSVAPAPGGGYRVSLAVWSASSKKGPTVLRRTIHNPLSSFSLADRLALDVASTVVGRKLSVGTLVVENSRLLSHFAVYADGHLLARNRMRLHLLTGRHEIVVAKPGGPLGDVPVEVFRVDIRKGKQTVLHLTRSAVAASSARPAHSPSGLHGASSSGTSHAASSAKSSFARVMYAGTLRGLSVTTDGGASWNRFGVLSGIPPGPVSAVAVTSGEIYAATAHGLAVSSDRGASWVTDTVGDGLASNVVNDVVVQGGVIYAATARGLCIGRNSGSSWSCYDATNGLGASRVRGVAVSGSSIYAATRRGISVSTNGGRSWRAVTAADGLGSSIVNGVFARGATVYAATAGGVSISTDRGLTWTSSSTSDGLASDRVNGVYADGAGIYAATAGGLSVSHDGGSRWTTFTVADGLISNDVNAVFAVGRTICIATTDGLSVSRDGGAHWSSYLSNNAFSSANVLAVTAR